MFIPSVPENPILEPKESPEPADAVVPIFTVLLKVIVFVYAVKLAFLQAKDMVEAVIAVHPDELASKITSSAFVGTAPPKIDVLPVLQLLALLQFGFVSPLQK
jgi:hypothetical protein